MSASRRGMLYMAAFCALWASVEALASHVLHAYSAYQVVWTRYGVHLIFMVLVWGWHAPRSLVTTGRPLFQITRSALMLIMPASWIIGMGHGLHAGTLMAIFWLSPLLILALAGIFLGERPSRRTWLAAVLASAGAVLLVRPEEAPSLQQLVWPLLMAGSFSAYVVMTRSLRTDTTRANLFYTAIGVFIALCPLMPFVWITPTLHDFAIFVGIGLLGAGALYALDLLAHAAPVSTPAPLTSLQAVFTILLGAPLGHFHPNILTWVGVLLVSTAALIAFRQKSGLIENRV
jgi:drug/metabolite transporter (DMT)-like permease